MIKAQSGFLESIQLTFDRLWLQIRIVLVLSETEFALRAEKGAFGVWGVLFEPIALMMTLLGLRILIRLKTTDLLNPVIWLACGVALLYMFRKIGIKALTGVSKRQKFFFYRRIRPLDTLLASALIEARVHGAVLFIILWKSYGGNAPNGQGLKKIISSFSILEPLLIFFLALIALLCSTTVSFSFSIINRQYYSSKGNP